MANQEFRALRRAIKNDRLRKVYTQAISSGWSALRDGSGHLRLTSPDGETTLTMSMTQVGARAALNVEAVYKRWLRQQKENTVTNERIERAIDMQEAGLETLGREVEPEPESASAERLEAMTEIAESAPTKRIHRMSQWTCLDCGKTMGASGKGTHQRMHRQFPETITRVPAERPLSTPSESNGHGEARFTIAEVVTIAEFGGTGEGGLVEINKLREGLLMVARLRRNE